MDMHSSFHFLYVIKATRHFCLKISRRDRFSFRVIRNLKFISSSFSVSSKPLKSFTHTLYICSALLATIQISAHSSSPIWSSLLPIIEATDALCCEPVVWNILFGKRSQSRKHLICNVRVLLSSAIFSSFRWPVHSVKNEYWSPSSSTMSRLL